MTKHIVKEKDTKTEKDNSPPPPVKSKEKDKKQPSEPQNKPKNKLGWSSNFTKGGKTKQLDYKITSKAFDRVMFG